MIDERIADDYVLHDSSMSDDSSWPRDPEGCRQMAEAGGDMIDGPVEIDRLVATDDWIVARFTVRGTTSGGCRGSNRRTRR